MNPLHEGVANFLLSMHTNRVVVVLLLLVFGAAAAFVTPSLPSLPSSTTPWKGRSNKQSVTVGGEEEVGGSKNVVHCYVLAHGFVGGENDLVYLRKAILEQAAQHAAATKRVRTVALCADCNEGKTFDGVRHGGERLASYIKDALTDIIMEEVTEDNAKPVVKLSVVGNSLGGLYARYAVRSLFLQGHLTLSKYNVQVEPATFATTASPWLGIASNTYLPLPRFMESAIGWTLSKTGKDLCRNSKIVYDMATQEEFLVPLLKFERRIAMANCYSTDFLVGQNTGLFLDSKNDTPHTPASVKSFSQTEMIKEAYTTEKTYKGTTAPPSTSVDADNVIASRSLDSLGWLKIAVDVRKTLPSLPRLRFKSTSSDLEGALTSAELRKRWGAASSDRVVLPNGHNMIVANQGKPGYEKAFKHGRPIMDSLAKLLVQGAPGESS
mmetsp:Transcript_44/g.88  ORF Transcript_44/g.88 Transcript_44/m.88 type:complete len:438 (-) Transcript_44:49-1362(-)